MQVTVMTTDGGTHPAYKWAEQSAKDLIEIPEDASAEGKRAGRVFEIQLINIFETFYEHVQAAECAQLDEDGDGRLESPLDGAEHDAEEVVEQIVAAAAGTILEAHVSSDVYKDRIRLVAAHHCTLIMDIERSWHADKSPTERAEHWREARRTLGPTLAHTALTEN